MAEKEKSQTTKERWNESYSRGIMRPNLSPSEILVNHRELLSGGKALDLACGMGQNSLYLARIGYEVDAIDVSSVALQNLRQEVEGTNLPVNIIEADLNEYRLAEDAYDVALVFYYLVTAPAAGTHADRRLLDSLKRSLKRGGLLFYRTYNVNHLEVAPSFSRKYLVEAGELEKLLSGFEVIFSDDAAGPKQNISSLVCRKPVVEASCCD